ncbi:MAG: hypothetical protein LBJ37_08695 [Paucimonas sp.]|jgi:hypothetical protein|nr:hypothetical protein [Paucimonas sp.]
MYWLEWMLWHIQTSPFESVNWQEKQKKYMRAKRAGRYKHEDSLPGIKDRVSEVPKAEGSIYSFNDTFMDVAAGESQERRGVVACVFLAIAYSLFEISCFAILANSVWFTGRHPTLTIPATASDFASGMFIALLATLAFYLVFRYARILFRLEVFVQRRMMIRFNRITRQVYLHRPRFAGGITVLDWEQVTVDAAVGGDEGSNAGRKLILFWEPKMPDLPHLHIAFVGKRADGTSDIVNLWEFIRRYMEEGPQSVPAPKKLLGKVPWPWLSVMASLSFFKPLWRAGLHWQVACIVALASPALALHSLGHWISLLLCWEPRWPRIIREAGLPGKPVPPLSTAADWPPLPKVEPKEKKSRRARKLLPVDAQLDEIEPDTQHQESK